MQSLSIKEDLTGVLNDSGKCSVVKEYAGFSLLWYYLILSFHLYGQPTIWLSN